MHEIQSVYGQPQHPPVTQTTTTTAAPLPFTGAETWPLVGLGCISLGVGLILAVIVRAWRVRHMH